MFGLRGRSPVSTRRCWYVYTKSGQCAFVVAESVEKNLLPGGHFEAEIVFKDADGNRIASFNRSEIEGFQEAK